MTRRPMGEAVRARVGWGGVGRRIRNGGCWWVCQESCPSKGEGKGLRERGYQ